VDRFASPEELVPMIGDWSAGSGPLYRKLARALRCAIESGDLPAGQRLPSERLLADALAVSRATVVAAYDELRAGGLLDSRQGSGTRVAAGVRTAAAHASDGRVPGGKAAAVFQRLIDGPGELITLACAAEPGRPEIADVLADVLREDLPALLADHGYRPRGLPVLRDALAAHFTGAGVATTADQVLATTGAQQALGLVAQLYVRPGAVVVVESPSSPSCLDVFRAAGARLLPVPVDGEGIRADRLAGVLASSQPALLYVMPSFNNPTGVMMSATRRRQVAALAARHGVPVLEDNTYAAYCGPADPPPPLAAYAPAGAGAEVLTAESLGKSVWGGLRVGWVRAPAEIIERLARRKALADLGGPVIEQAVAARLLPRLPELVAARTAELRERLDLMENLLREQLPAWRWRRPAGGASLWVELSGVDAGVYAQVALRHGVEVVPGAAMDATGEYDDCLRLPFTFAPPTIVEMVSRLARAWAELERHGPTEATPLRPVI
jgi:DNA-binding transcriptional MocR family regulator